MDHIETEKKFIENAFNAKNDIFLIFELESGKALKWNKRFNKISGYTDEEISLLNIPNSFCDPFDLLKAYEFIRKILKDEIVGALYMSLVTKSGGGKFQWNIPFHLLKISEGASKISLS